MPWTILAFASGRTVSPQVRPAAGAALL